MNEIEKLKTLVAGDYVNIGFYDVGDGLAQIVDVNDNEIILRWARFFPCYSCQVYDESQYKENKVYPLDLLFEVKLEHISEKEFETIRAEWLLYDTPIFERYKRLESAESDK